MRNQIEDLAAWSIANPTVATTLIVCLQLLVLAGLVGLLARFAINRDVVLKYRLWRLVVALALVSLPLHIVVQFCGLAIHIPRAVQTANGDQSAKPIFETSTHTISSRQFDTAATIAVPNDSESRMLQQSNPTVTESTDVSASLVSFLADHLMVCVSTVYLLGVLCWFLRIAYMSLRLHSKIRRMPQVESSLYNQVKHLSRKFDCPEPSSVCVSETSTSPYIFGFLQPTLVVPRDFDRWSDCEIRAALSHELAHIKGNDFLWSLLSQIMTGIYWPHPASWWINRCVVRAREQAADEQAIEVFNSRTEYGRVLIQIVERFSCETKRESRVSSLAITMSAFDDLTQRVKTILEGSLCATKPVRWIVRAVAGAAIACTLIASLKLRHSMAQEVVTPQDQPPQANATESELVPATRPSFNFTNITPGEDDNDLIKVLLNCKLTAEVEPSDALVFNFKGNVLDRSGKPVESATVLLMEACYNTKLAMLEDLALKIKDKPYAQLPSVTAKTYTASDGSFAFTEAKPAVLQGYEPGMWQGAIVAVHKDHGLQWERLNHSNYKIVDRQPIKLVPVTSISGVFKDPDGKPLPDAAVSICGISSSNEDRFYDNLSVAFTELQPTAVTDSQGRFTFSGIPESTIAYVQCKHPAWAVSGASFKTTQFKPPFQWDQRSPLLSSPGIIVAQSEVIFRGRITGPEREPAQGMRVSVSGAIASTMSDKNGEYFIALPKAVADETLADQGSLVNVFPGKGSPYLSTRVPLGIIGYRNKYCETDIVVSKGVWVSGKLADENDGPAEGIQIFAFTQDGKDSAYGYSDPLGVFGFYVSPKVNQLVFACGSIPYQLPSFNDVTKLGTQSANRSEPVSPPSSWTAVEIDASHVGAIELPTIHVKRLKPFEVQVVSHDGSAVANAKIVLEDYVDPGDYFFPVSQNLVTNAEGKVSITSYGLLSERAVAVTTYLSSTGVTHYRRTLLSEAQDGNLTVMLDEQPLMRGRVLVNGSPIEGAVVQIMLAEWAFDSRGNRVKISPIKKPIMTAVTGNDGNFAVAIDSVDECMVSLVSIPKYGRLSDTLFVIARDKNNQRWLFPDLDVIVEDEEIIEVLERDRK